MGLIRFAIDNPVKVTVGVILLVLSGLLSLTRMRVQLTPDVDRPIITVTTRWIGASPQEIEREIVERQEEKLKNVSGLQKIRSECTRNQAKIELEFPVGIDKDTAFRDVSDKLRQVSGYPEEVDEPTISASSDSMELTIAWMILYSKEGMDVSRLKTFIEDHVKPILERAEGISEVPVYGGRDREVQVVLDAHRLAARSLTFRDVEKALRQQNESSSAGTIATGKRDYSYRTIGEYVTLGDIEDTVIAYDDGGPVLVRDVASVVQGFKKPVSFVRSKGRPVMALPARRETNANVIKAMTNLKRQIQLVNREILQPRGLSLELTQVYDETTYIWSAIYLVVKNIAVGGFLAVLVLLLFLRSGSATVIIAATIPVSVIGTFLVITMVGRSLNVVLLAGMAFAVGMVVDNAIVVLENIYRHRAMGKSKVEAALDGTREVWGAILASTLTTMAVFLPMITIQEEAGQLFKDIAVAIATAVGLSLLVSILVIPPLASRFFGASSAQRTGDKPWRIAAWVSSRVTAINQRVGRRVAVVVGVSGAALVGSYALMPATEYLTAGNKNLVFGFLFSPPGYSIDEFRRMAHIIEDGDPDDPLDGLRPFWEAELGSPEAAALPSVEIQVGKDGRITRTVQPPPIENFFFVSFSGGSFMGCTSKEPTNVKPLEQVMTRASSRIPGVFTMFNQSSLFRTGGRRGGNTIDMEIRSASLEKVVASASAIRQRIREAGYGWASSTPENFALGRPELRLIPDRAKAADLGLDVRDLGFILRACIDGAFVGEFNDHGDRIDLVLKVADTEEATMDEIGWIPIYTPSGHVVPISASMNFIRTTAPQQITRIEEMPSVTLSIKPKTGVALQDTMRELEEEVIQPLRESGAIPSSVITALTGTADKLTQTREALIGKFDGVVQRPRIMGLSPWLSMATLAVLAALIVGVIWWRADARAAFLAASASVVVLTCGFFVLNPELALAVLQSRAILALLITYLLMAALFESFAYPLVIMLSVPLAAVGGFASLRIVHEVSLYDVTSPIQQLDVLTMLGFVILIGIVVNNAILIVHQALHFMREEGLTPAEAVAKSVQVRTRPIFMSAATSIFGMLPLVVMPGAGSELYRGLGSVVLGGLLVSTIFTLVVVPAMFTLLTDFQQWLRGVLGARETGPAQGMLAASSVRHNPRS
ncbi:MAG: efflux RND transporter permease subunit [Planctomycetes bacterium]|nr:efflux RND transporter permease subunit [Planctomycetota bacterium]